ncbi:MAG: hypothetical protein ACXWLH_04795 [Candidatus Saccharimonadales bacterium]
MKKEVTKKDALKRINEIMKEHRKKQGHNPLNADELNFIEKDTSLDFTKIIRKDIVNGKIEPTQDQKELIEKVTEEFYLSYKIIDYDD